MVTHGGDEQPQRLTPHNGELVVANKETIAALVQCLQDDDSGVIQQAIRALSQLDAHGRAMQVALVEVVRTCMGRSRAGLELNWPMRRPVVRWDVLASAAIGELARIRARGDEIENMVLDLLHDSERELQSLGLRACQALEVDGNRIRETLRRLLDEKDEDLRTRVINILQMRTPSVPSVTAVLYDRLENSNPWLRLEAAKALIQAGEQGDRIVDTVLACLNDEEEFLRCEMVEWLPASLLPEPRILNALLRAAGDPASSVRKAVAEQFNRQDLTSPTVIAAVVGLLDDTDNGVRLEAATALVAKGQVDGRVIAALIDCLDDEYDHTYEGAAAALAEISDAHPEALEAAIDRLFQQDLGSLVLEDGPSHVDVGAGHRAWSALFSGDRTCELLFQRMTHADRHTRLAAVRVFPGLGWWEKTSTGRIMPALRNALTDEWSEVRATAAIALAYERPLEPATVSALIRCLSDPSPKVRFAAATTFGHTETDNLEAADRLLAHIDDEAPGVREAVIEALVHQKSSSSQIVSALLARLEADPAIGVSIAATLIRLGASTQKAVAILLAALSKRDAPLSRKAATALGALANPEPELVKLLLEQLANQEFQVSSAAMTVLSGLAHQHVSVRSVVITQFQHEDPLMRRRVAQLLGSLDLDDMATIVPALRDRLKDPVADVREAALYSLATLAGKEKQQRSNAMYGEEAK